MSLRVEQMEIRESQNPARVEVMPKPAGNFFMVDNGVIDYFTPLVGTVGVTLYNIYRRLENKRLGYAYPSLTRLEKSLGISRRTIIRTNQLLERYKLIRVLKGAKGRSNRYKALPPKVTPEIKAELEKRGFIPLTDSLHFKNFPGENLDTGGSDTRTPGSDTRTPGSDTRAPGVVTPEHSNKTNKQNKGNKTKQQQDQVDNLSLTDREPLEQTKSEGDVVVDDFVNSEGKEEESREKDLTEPFCEVSGMKPTPSIKTSIDKLSQKHGDHAVRGKIELLSAALKAGKPITNRIGWLTRACQDDYQPHALGMGNHLAQEPKPAGVIENDAHELRNGASVTPEESQELAENYESYYLRRNIAQIKRDYEKGRRYREPGAELVRRVKGGYEPPDYPDRRTEEPQEPQQENEACNSVAPMVEVTLANMGAGSAK